MENSKGDLRVSKKRARHPEPEAPSKRKKCDQTTTIHLMATRDTVAESEAVSPQRDETEPQRLSRASQALPTVCCRDHPGGNLVEDHRGGDVICTQCGLVVVEHVFDPLIGPSTEGPLDEESLGVLIDPETGAASFGEFGNSKNQNRTTRGNLRNALEDLRTIADRVHVTRDVIDEARNLLKQVYNQSHLKRMSSEIIAAACLYISCRQGRVPRTFQDIATASGIRKNQISKCFQKIMEVRKCTLEPVSAGDYVPRFCRILNLPYRVERVATFIARKAEELGLASGRTPLAVAGAAILMKLSADAQKRTIREIAAVIGILPSTVSDMIRQMGPHAAQLFPPVFNSPAA